jgi:hypothetical protein
LNYIICLLILFLILKFFIFSLFEHDEIFSFGFNYLNDDDPQHQYYINSIRPNKSHDLRLLDIINTGFVHQHSIPSFAQLLRNVVYRVGLRPQDAEFGTRPANSGFFTSLIYNVTDAEKALRDIILLASEKTKNDNVLTQKLGDLHIYTDGSNIRFET